MAEIKTLPSSPGVFHLLPSPRQARRTNRSALICATSFLVPSLLLCLISSSQQRPIFFILFFSVENKPSQRVPSEPGRVFTTLLGTAGRLAFKANVGAPLCFPLVPKLNTHIHERRDFLCGHWGSLKPLLPLHTFFYLAA